MPSPGTKRKGFMSAKYEIRDCMCERDNIYLYIAWKIDRITHAVDILAICRTEELARKYCNNYKASDLFNTSTWVDKVVSDHLLGSTMFGKRL